MAAAGNRGGHFSLAVQLEVSVVSAVSPSHTPVNARRSGMERIRTFRFTTLKRVLIHGQAGGTFCNGDVRCTVRPSPLPPVDAPTVLPFCVDRSARPNPDF